MKSISLSASSTFMANPKNKALVRASIILLAAIALVGGYFAAEFAKPKYEIHGFNGRALEVKESSILMRGVYTSDRTLPKSLLIQRDLEFTVDANTQFEKIATILPTEEVVRKNGGTFNMKNLATINQTSSFAEMKGLTASGPYFSIDIESSANMYGAERPVATKIVYRPAIFSGRIDAPESP